MSTPSLIKEVRRLKARQRSRRREIPKDRMEFAREVGIDPDPWQEELLGSTSRRILINASRQSGKSTVAGVIALHTALYTPGSLVLIVAPAQRQSVESFSKVLDAYRSLGRPISPRSEQKMSLSLQNGSRIVSLPGSEKTIRGFSGAELLIVDEASRIEDRLYHATRPMLAVSNGGLIMASTPYGRRGVFYDTWQNGGSEWHRFEIPAYKVPRISEEFLAEEREALPQRVFRQEYLCKFEESQSQVFSEELIDAAFDDSIEPLWPGE